MIYYKYLITTSDGLFNGKADKKEIDRVNDILNEFNSNLEEGDLSINVTSIEKTQLKLSISSSLNSESDIEREIVSLLQALGINPEYSIEKEEVSVKEFAKSISDGTKQGFINDPDDICQKYTVGDKRYCLRQNDFNEEMIGDDLDSSIVFQSIEEEKKRIFSPSAPKEFICHPVHYVIASDNEDLRIEMRRQLLSALYKANRLKSRRVSILSLNPLQNVFSANYKESGTIANRLYNKGEGGTVIISGTKAEEENDDCFTPSDNGELEAIMFNANMHRDNVLTVIELDDNEESLNEIKELSDKMDFVILKENLVYGQGAKEYLQLLAKKDGINNIESLLDKVVEGEGYHYSNLSSLYKTWKEERKKSAFPAYSSFMSNLNIENAKKPKGNAYKELQGLIGLENAKRVIDEAIAYFNMESLMAKRNLKISSPSRHMVFYGAPGTAKTTVARLFAQIMKENGVLSKGELVEVGRKDLVGKYVGWTAMQVERVFKIAEGSVLFIDEAYSLVDGRDKLYGQEAINTIVQMMENMRENTIVIFAGYEKEMKEFINQNPGLRSRIPFHVHFPDYSDSELLEILKLVASKNNYSLTEGAECKARDIFKTASLSKDFGNGRFVRNLFEKATMKKALRLSSSLDDFISDTELLTLREEDFEMPEEYSNERKTRVIGFTA
ncbi:MAG: AAA family ATPase [Spirochaetales bacterium]|nr:AAA family ATPase [Spirochaetales bacterium]